MVSAKKTGEFGLNESYVEILRSQWLKDSSSVASEWQDYFSAQRQPEKPQILVDELKPKIDEKKNSRYC